MDPKYTVPIVLFPALFGGLGGALKSYLQNRKAKDDFDTVEDHDTTKNDENNNEIIKHKENSSNAIYWKIILGIVGLVLIVLLFSYRKQLPIIVLGLDRWARIKGWDEKGKKYFYRLYFGHEKYKRQFPKDWWKLYIEDEDNSEFLGDLETEGNFDEVITGFVNAHKSYNGDLHRIVIKNFSLLIKRYIEAFGYEKYKSKFPKDWWEKNFGNCECGDLYYANLDPYSKEFEEVFFELMKNRFNKDKAVERRVGLMEDTLFQILKKYPSTAYCALIMPGACEWELSENKDKLLVKIGDKFINFEIIVYLALSAQDKYKELIVSSKKFDEAQKEILQFEKKISKAGGDIKFSHRIEEFEPIIDEETKKILDLGEMFMYSPLALKFQELDSSLRMVNPLGAMLEIPEFVTFQEDKFLDGNEERFTNGEKKVMESYIPLGLFVERFVKGKSSNECKKFVKEKYIRWFNKYKKFIVGYESEKEKELNKKISKQGENAEKYKRDLENLQKYKKQRESLMNEVGINEIEPGGFGNFLDDLN